MKPAQAVLLCNTRLAQSMSPYYFVLQSLHNALPSATLCYKACTQYFFALQSLHPVLLCTTKLAQSTSQYYLGLCTTRLAQSMSQYYFVLQSLNKALPSYTLYYTACTKHFPVLLCTTKLARSTSQYYFVLQSLHKLGTRLTGGREEFSTPAMLSICFSADLQWSEHSSPFWIFHAAVPLVKAASSRN